MAPSFLPLAAAAAAVGLLVGLTGSGGGALMTPLMLVLFGVAPSAAISSDLVASVVLRPVGVFVHGRAGAIDWPLVRRLSVGSVPAALVGAFLAHRLGRGTAAETVLRELLGGALLLGAGAMLAGRRFGWAGALGRARTARSGPRVSLCHHRCASQDRADAHAPPRRRPATVLVGTVAGLIVGATSVGAGSLVLVALRLLHPRLRTDRLVGTDLAQAVPVTLAAALGALLWGHIVIGLTTAVILGGLPGVIVGALLCPRLPERWVGATVLGVVLIAGLASLGVGGPALLLGAAASVAAVGLWRMGARLSPRRGPAPIVP
ncbi:sulfite exporter TauE/SafE family protein [Conexibacter sp. DBS9H8]|uniref:sulfite exporter TauE/SafE family protein n=1 Tax=Conexibacter sp. DBS9H8 TaxID=2937801 RepID=UPI00200CE448|nr:sulfite exporter TauE/SafE family protein [Conexibacter sp. DBS9H8]